MLQNSGGGLNVLYALQWVHGRALVGVQEVEYMKNVGAFISGGQINSFKQKKRSKLTHFEGKFNVNML